MRCLFTGICILLCFGSAALRAQQGSTSKTQDNSGKATCSIGGTVLKSGTADPVRKAEISLRKVDDPRSGYLTHTDSMGRFAIDKIEAGRYRLHVERSGYVSQEYGESFPASAGAILTLTPGHEANGLVFRLIPWAVISGRVRDENGDPLPDVSIQTMRYITREGKRNLEPASEAETNDLGEYRIYGLTKGRYFVRAINRENRFQMQTDLSKDREDSNASSGYAPVYYPGTSDETRAVSINVEAGQEAPAIDFTLIPIRSFRVRGHVFDAMLGQVPKDCIVYLIHHDPATLDSRANEQGQTVCEKGTFEFTSVPPGAYSVVARTFGDGKVRSARALLNVGETNVNDVGITLTRGMSLSGRISVEGDQSLDPSEVQIWLKDNDDFFGNGAGSKIKPDGTLTFENVPEGNYEFEIYGRPPGFSPDFYMKDALVNGESVLDKGLAVPAADSQRSVEVVISSAGARVDGTVTDENDLPTAGATVALVPEEGRRKMFRLYKDSTTDQYGKFVLRGIAPGKYKLFAWKDVENDLWQDPDFLKRYEDQGKEITAEERGRITVQLKLAATQKSQPQH
ncbi:MAG TPA: carboxypeptidase-like regulatory domain-containing protein [Candidatus Dormibacteraeota bacterium]|nr:carboxypeptidase-like regulatory domain-containing protein [Candidatus Dormibacteraeota bacterium]